MFQNLSDRFQSVFTRLRSRGVLQERHLSEAHDAVREALLEADVHHSVIDPFLDRVREATVGQNIVKSLTPADQYLKVVYGAMVSALGSKTQEIHFGGKTPAVLLMVGLQGSGKTTSSAKLAHWCKSQKRRPLLVPVDLARPAAVEQLHALGKEWDLDVHMSQGRTKAVDVVRDAVDQARRELYDTIIIDTAGRLHIDQALMDELADIAKVAEPSHSILVSDAMAGQQALVTAQAFNNVTPLSGVIVSKADGDARGGVALSCSAVLDVPVYFLGIGEKVDALEAFHPDRMASRILGMGDLATLAERVEKVTDQETALERVKKLAGGKFTLEDYREQIREMGKMDQMESLLKMIPGAQKILPQVDMAQLEKDMKVKTSIIDSMTLQERGNTKLLNGSRRKRIALGCGRTVTDVNRLIKEFEIMQKMMKKGGRQKMLGALGSKIGRPGMKFR